MITFLIISVSYKVERYIFAVNQFSHGFWPMEYKNQNQTFSESVLIVLLLISVVQNRTMQTLVIDCSGKCILKLTRLAIGYVEVVI